MNYIPLLKNLLGLLKLGDYQIAHEALLAKAAAWSLNSNSFPISEYKAVALKPILATLNNKKRHSNKFLNHFIPARSLSLSSDFEKNIFPSEIQPSINELQKQLEVLKSKLQNAPDDRLLMFIELHGSTLAVNHNFQDIPLSEFIKTTIGIALCLEKNNTEICLCGGAISGIQTYLYDIISKNASRLLKGRSFYLQLLIDALLQETVEQFDLSPCHIVYASGGGFYILMPKNAKTKSGLDLESFASEITHKIFDKHYFGLFFEIAVTTGFNQDMVIKTVNEKGEEKITNAWSELNKLISSKKSKRLTANDNIKEEFFKEFVETGGTKTEDRDHITNEEFKEQDNDRDYHFELLVRKITNQQCELGRDLRSADYWVFAKNNIGGQFTISDPLGNKHYFKETGGKNLKTFNKPEVEDYPTVFYGGNEVPCFKAERLDELNKANEAERKSNSLLKHDPYELGDIKPFEFLVGDGDLSRMAILRMDVDDLGSIFSENIGVNNGKKNICRYSTTSKSLDIFFKGYLNTLRKKYDDTISIIYSGGDDLFIVGKWNHVFELAEKINSEFQKWSCQNLTISGGIVLVPPKFPIMQSARLAAVAENKAKDHCIIEKDGIKTKKNAICIFDIPLHWEVEFSIVKKLYDEILPLIQSDSLSMSFINKIMKFAETQKLYSKLLKYEDKIKNNAVLHSSEIREVENLKKMNLLRWKWNMAYDLTRFSENKSSAKTEKAEDFVKTVMKNSFANSFDNTPISSKSNYSFLELLQIACRWVELDKRTELNTLQINSH